MPVQTLIGGRIRGGAGATDERFADLNEMREQIVGNGLPPFTEMSRLGNGWTVFTASAVAPLTAAPTTVAALEVFNNSSGPGAFTIVVADLIGFETVTAASAITRAFSLWGMVTTQKAVPTLTANALTSLSGRQSITPLATSPIVTGAGTTVVANGWRPYGNVQAWGINAAGATPGGTYECPVNGRMIVPPGCSLCVQVTGSVSTGTFQVGATFYLAAITASLMT